MKIINDFIVNEGEEAWCGILITIDDKAVWIFERRPHGYDVTWGFKGGAKGRNFRSSLSKAKNSDT